MYKLIFILTMIFIMLLITNKIYNSFIVAMDKQGQNLNFINK